MIKYLTLILLLSTIILKAQIKNSPSGPLDNQNSRLTYNEKIQVTQNSTFLLVGESLLFNVQCFDSFKNVPSDLSSIAYVELINEEAKPVLQTRIDLNGGLGSGDFFLPSTLVTGNYTLIAYTHWMRNFSSDYFFTSTITIINPFKKPSHQFSTSEKEMDIAFFPEGGQILSGNFNAIGYIISSNPKKNNPYTVRIVDDFGSTITETISSTDGSGIVTLSPLQDRVYKAIVSDAHTTFIKNLPSSKEEGIGIRTVRSEEFIDVNLTYRGKENDRSATLVVQHQGNNVHQTLVNFISDTVNIKISKKILPAGLSRITILNTANRVEGERAIYIRPDLQKQLSIALEKKEFKHREKVSLKINAKDSIGPAYLSVSVRKIEKNISNTVLSDNNIDYAMSDKLIDFYCLTYRRKERTYNPGTDNELQNIKYLPEVRGITINGMVKSLTDTPIVNELVYMSLPSTNYLFHVSKTDSSGNFYFITNKIKYTKDIILQLSPEHRNKYQIKIKNEFPDNYSKFTPPPLFIDSSFSELIKQRSIFTQLENVYYSEKRDSIIPGHRSNRFYGLPDKSYFLDNYVRFPTLEDVLIEYIPEISLRKKGELYNIKVVNFKTGVAFSEDPLILLDGIPVFDHNQIIDLNPLLIKKIEIIKRRYFYGPLDLSGIISLETYDGDGMNTSFKDYTIKEMVGIQPEKNYYKPSYSKEDSKRIPDFRIQLYWEPSLLVNKSTSIEFYTSDVDGDFEISVVGSDLKGNKILLKETFSVNQREN